MQHQKVSENMMYILFPGALGQDSVYRRKFNAICWRTWFLEQKRKEKKRTCAPVRM